MHYQNLWKQLKRRLRMRKRWLSLGTVLLVAGLSAVGWWSYDVGSRADKLDQLAIRAASFAVEDAADQSAEKEATRKAIEAIRAGKEKRDVYVQKRFVCGEETERLGMLSPNDVLAAYSEFPSASVRLGGEGKVYISYPVEDLAPRCKDTAYFGLDKDGNLSLFDGLPEKEKVIRTFFQLNVQHMKSSLPQETVKQLYSGIRISDIGDYNSVLSTFSEYAVEDAAPVSNQQ